MDSFHIVYQNQTFHKMNSDKYSPLKSVPNFSQLILDTMEILLAKIIQLTHQVQNIAKETMMPKSGLINITDKKTIPQMRKTTSGYDNIKNEFQTMLSRIVQYKNGASFDKKMMEFSPSSPAQEYNSFQYEQVELKLLKVQEDFKKQNAEIKNRLMTIEEDIGQILLFYKDLIFDK